MIAAVSALGMTAALGGCGTTGLGEVTPKLVAADYGDSEANSSQKYWDDLAKEYEDTHPDVKVDVSVYSWNDVVNRTRYGVPFAASTRLLFYNKKLFTAAGLTPPTTWNELAADAAALKDEGVKYPYALPLGPEEAQAETMQWLLSGGDGYTSAVGTYGIDSPQNIRTFTWLKDELVDKGLTGPVAPGKLNRAAAFAAFARGEVGMLNGHPSLMKIAAAKGVDVGMVPMPGEESSTRSAMGVADWMMAFKENGHGSQAGDFLDLVYDEKNVLAFSREYDLLPVTTSASQTMATATRDKDLAPFLAELPTAQLYPVGKTPGHRSERTSSSGSVRRSRRAGVRRGCSRSCRRRPMRRRTPSRPGAAE